MKNKQVKALRLGNTDIVYTMNEEGIYMISSKAIANAMNVPHVEIVKEALIALEESKVIKGIIKEVSTIIAIPLLDNGEVVPVLIDEASSYMVIGRTGTPESHRFISEMYGRFSTMRDIAKDNINNIDVDPETEDILKGIGVIKAVCSDEDDVELHASAGKSMKVDDYTIKNTSSGSEEYETVKDEVYAPVLYSEWVDSIIADKDLTTMAEWAKLLTQEGGRPIHQDDLIQALKDLGYHDEHTLREVHVHRGMFRDLMYSDGISETYIKVITAKGIRTLSYGIRTYLDKYND